MTPTFPPMIMVQWKIGVSPILVSFHLRLIFHFQTLWQKGEHSIHQEINQPNNQVDQPTNPSTPNL